MGEVWGAKLVIPFLLQLLLCPFSSSQGPSSDWRGPSSDWRGPSSDSQGLSSGLPPREEVSYTDIQKSITDPILPDVTSACNSSLFTDLRMVIECQENATKTGKNVISVTIREVTWDGRFHTAWGGIFNTVSSFTHLQELVISIHKIKSRIPPKVWGSFTNLTKIDLSYNMLRGPIPEDLGGLSMLTELSLSHNLLSGSIPTSFADLRSLQKLDLSMNKLSGPIPKFLSKMTSLIELDLGSNSFTGKIPSELGMLLNLTHLILPSNNLSGPIPSEYGQLKNLEHFSVAGNNLNGLIPDFIQNWIKLSRLELMGNNFEGGLPQAIFGLTALEALWVSDLNNSGIPFPSLAKLKHLKFLILRRCGISGLIREDINGMMNLIHLDLSYNNLTGGIPDSLSEIPPLSDLSLAGNKLDGAFPYWAIEDGRELLVDLSNNNLTLNQTLKTESLSMKNLFGCCSSYTNVSDGSSLMNMTSDPYQLMQAHCPRGKPKHNSLHINCGNGEKFQQYEADNASSSVHISSEGKWAYSCSGHFMASTLGSYAGRFFSTSGIGYTQKTKCAASPLFETARLCPVSLTYYGFCLHRGEYIVQLHFAEVVYNEDENYGSLKDRVFDVYIQDEKKVSDLNIKERAGAPNRPWNETHRVTVKDDSLLKVQLLWAGKGAITDDPLLNGPLISGITVTPAPKPKKLTPWQIALVVLASIIFALLLILAFVWKMGWLESKKWQETPIQLRNNAVITIKQIIDATDKFTKHEIGRGGFGIVYKVAAQDQIVAVKKLITDNPKTGGSKIGKSKTGESKTSKSKSRESQTGLSNTVKTELKEEMYALKSLEHENLIKFFDGFSREDLHLLVYEFMENGGLDSALSDGESKIKLNWEQRYDICLGIAKGLRHMHEEKAKPIIHRDLKTSNVLLDGNLKAKISDFGLAKVYDETNCVDEVGGTNGYMAPEYAMRGIYSNKTDVYSYGVMILEIMSGESNAIDTSSGQRKFLLDRAFELHRGGKLLVDKKLKSNYNHKQATTIMYLAMACLNISPASRPKMSEVVDVLEGKKAYTTLISPAASEANMCPDCKGTGIRHDVSTIRKEEEKNDE